MFSLTPRQRNRLLLWLGLGILVAVLLWAARGVLLPYVLGLVLAYFLLPLVNWLDRHMPHRLKGWQIARPLAILLTYLLLLAIVGGVVAFIVPLLNQQISYTIENWPKLAERAKEWGERGWTWYQTIPADWRATIETNVEGLAADVLTGIQNALMATARTVFSTFGFILGMIVIPFWLFYILLDENKVKKGVLGAFPERMRADMQALGRMIDDVLSAYLRGQLLLMLFVGGMATIAFMIIGVPFAIVLGLIAGLFEILPYVGPILGAIPAVIVALLNEPISALYVAAAVLVIQQVENIILVPRIAGQSVKLHPALVMVVLVIGNEVGGFIGMVTAVPLAAILRDVFKYLYLRMLDEPLSPGQAAARVRAGRRVRLDL